MKKIGLAILIITMLSSMVTAENCSCTTELNQLQDNLTVMNSQLNQMRNLVIASKEDTSAMRRMVEVQNRKLDELEARNWASSGEIENLSKEINATHLALTNELNNQLTDLWTKTDFKFRTIKSEVILLVLLSITLVFVMTEWIYGSKYREFLKRAGVFPRRTPITDREQKLELKLGKTLEQLEEERKKKPSKKKDSLITVIAFLIMLLLALGTALIMGWI